MPVTSRDLLIAVIFSLTLTLVAHSALAACGAARANSTTERCDPLERPTLDDCHQTGDCAEGDVVYDATNHALSVCNWHQLGDGWRGAFGARRLWRGVEQFQRAHL